eukprot:CAMPEP_0175393404 /NCGR_PEP_ID=MMETSP0095-20121207/32912_1 /TAXON_ID=311494 /ORGANISM="Alexandrium monilatum, Strain CCMP3105" /LENGTH=266 /DNA_ID=CAMNT_0016691995 /DNA_START=60 /DNA_END=857 /DNA_ORIENTATION=+
MCGFRAGLSAFAAAVLLVVGAERPSKYHHTIEEGRVQVIESHQPVPLAVRPGGSVLEFGPLLFDGNVVQEHGKSHPDHWVVLFCPSWWEPCQAFVEIYQDQAEHWQLRLNNGLLNARTRFAVVDCAIHKVLCNEQAVEDYPTIVHYGRGVRVGQFTMNGKTDPDRFVAWLEAQLGHVPAAASQEAPAASSGCGARGQLLGLPFGYGASGEGAAGGTACQRGRGCGRGSAGRPAARVSLPARGLDQAGREPRVVSPWTACAAAYRQS